MHCLLWVRVSTGKGLLLSNRQLQDPDKKKTMEDDYYNKTMPDFVNLIAKLLTQNGGKHLVGDEV